MNTVLKYGLRVAALAGIVTFASRYYRRETWLLRGRTVLILGGSRGLGLALAREYAGRGAHLALVARDAEELERARSDLEPFGVGVLTLVGDVTDAARVKAVVDETVAHYGRLDVLVNNAGVIQAGPEEHMKDEDFQASLDVHFWGPLHSMRAAARHMRRGGGGRIVNISSIGGKVAVPHLSAYCAGKFALVGLSDALRAEWAQHGIHVTTVCPGLMRTGSHLNAGFKGKRSQEFAWFSLMDATPLTSVAAERAAASIVQACVEARPQLVVSPQAKLAVLANALLPGLTAGLMSIVARFLPGPVGPEGDEAQPGRDHPSAVSPSPLTRLADEAAARLNELQARGRST